mgnify:CR=1 FL=1
MCIRDRERHEDRVHGQGALVHEVQRLWRSVDQVTMLQCRIAGNQLVERSKRIKDTGQGISDKDMEHIFDRFYRSRESRIEYSSGLGLGLSISSHIIKLHKGNIEVTSEIGEGSTFKITLPIKGNKCKF